MSYKSTFPLYNTIKEDVKNKWGEELTDEEFEKIKSYIPKLDQNGRNLMYVLIKAHSLVINEEKDGIPFNGSVKKERSDEGKDIEFNFGEFPTMLKQIIYRFLDLHMKHLKLKNS